MKIYAMILSVLGLLVGGCAAADQAQMGNAASDGGVVAAPGSDQRPVGYVGGKAIHRGDLWALLVEAKGGEVLSELILDRQIARALSDRGETIEPATVDQEKSLLLATLDADSDQAQRLLGELRQRRGLGEHRFRKLLKRNAGLRLLVQDEVEVSDAAVDQAYQLEHGPRYEARLIVTGSLVNATELVRRARAGESFIDLAIAHSSDASRAQGGLIGSVSLVDPTLPKAVRVALGALEPGQVSDPVALERGFAVLRLERKVEGTGVDPDQVKAKLTEKVRRRVEWVLMQRRARTMLSEADVVVLDPLLHTDWQRRRGKLLGGR